MEGSSSLLSNVPVRHCGGIVVERRNRVNAAAPHRPSPHPSDHRTRDGRAFRAVRTWGWNNDDHPVAGKALFTRRFCLFRSRCINYRERAEFLPKYRGTVVERALITPLPFIDPLFSPLSTLSLPSPPSHRAQRLMRSRRIFIVPIESFPSTPSFNANHRSSLAEESFPLKDRID